MKFTIIKLVLIILLFIVIIFPVYAENHVSKEQQTKYFHTFFLNYTDFHEYFHSFFNLDNPLDYLKISRSDWQKEYDKLLTTYQIIHEIVPPEKYKESHKNYLLGYKKLLDNLNNHIEKIKTTSTKEDDIIEFMTNCSVYRIDISRSYAEIYSYFATLPQEQQKEVNTPELMKRWHRMEDRKKMLLNKY